MGRASRSYRDLPDFAVCLKRGCSWHWQGPDAERLAEDHWNSRFHPTQVTSSSVVSIGIRDEDAGRAAAVRAAHAPLFGMVTR